MARIEAKAAKKEGLQDGFVIALNKRCGEICQEDMLTLKTDGTYKCQDPD